MKASLVVTTLSCFLGVATSDTIDPGFGRRPPTWIKYDIPKDFKNPVGLARPTFRYWIPDADVNDTVLVADLQQMKNAGWGGVEIICLENYGIEPDVVDPALYGYGGTDWYGKFNLLLHEALKLDMRVDFALGPTQGASIPILDPDSPGMNTELAYGLVNLTAGQSFSGSLPQPQKVDPGYANAPDFDSPFINYTNKFVAAVVARKSSSKYEGLLFTSPIGNIHAEIFLALQYHHPIHGSSSSTTTVLST